MDGLLLDTEIIYTKVTQQIVGRFGKTFDWSIKANMIGRAQLESARYLVETLSLPITAEQYIDERNDMLKRLFAECGAMPGAESLIRHLHDNGIPIALASSSYEDMYQIKTMRHRSWFDLFDVIVTGDNPNIKNGKPAPDIFLYAAECLKGKPSEALVFEDAPSGLQAGKAAGMQVVVVRHPEMDAARFKEADLVLDSLEDFNPELFGLPLW